MSKKTGDTKAIVDFVRSRGHENRFAPGALKLKPAAQYLGGLSVPTMHRLIRRGLLRPNRSTRHYIFTLQELDRFLNAGMDNGG